MSKDDSQTPLWARGAVSDDEDFSMDFSDPNMDYSNRVPVEDENVSVDPDSIQRWNVAEDDGMILVVDRSSAGADYPDPLPSCGVEKDFYTCTREAGHAGDHRDGDDPCSPRWGPEPRSSVRIPEDTMSADPVVENSPEESKPEQEPPADDFLLLIRSKVVYIGTYPETISKIIEFLENDKKLCDNDILVLEKHNFHAIKDDIILCLESRLASTP